MFWQRSIPGNLVIKDHVIQYVETRFSQGSLGIKRVNQRFLPEGILSEGKIIDFETLSIILEQCVEEWKIKGKHVRFALPNQMLVVRHLTVPATINEEDIKAYLYLELGSSIHLPFQDPVFDFTIVSSDNTGKEIQLFAAPEEELLGYVHLFETVKLDAVAIVPPQVGAYGLLQGMDLAGNTDHLMIIQYDIQDVNVSIFHRQVPLLIRQLKFDTELKDWEIQYGRSEVGEFKWVGEPEKFQLAAEDIFTEIGKVVDYYRYNNGGDQDQSIGNIFLCGDLPDLEYVSDSLTDRLGVQSFVATGDSSDLPDVLQPSFFMAAGLSFSGNLNLLPQKEAKDFRKFRYLLWVIIILMVFMAGGWIVYDVTLKKQAVQSELKAVEKLSEIRQKQLLESEQKSVRSTHEKLINWAEAEQLPSVYLLDQITSSLPEHGYLLSLGMVEGNELKLVVQFDAYREAAYYLYRLKQSPTFSTALLKTVTAQPTNDENLLNSEITPRYMAEYALQIDKSTVKAETLKEGREH